MSPSPEVIIGALGFIGVLATSILSYRGGSSQARELVAGAMERVAELRTALKEETAERKTLENRVDEQDKLIAEILAEKESLRRENVTLQRKVTELEARLNGVEESGEIRLQRKK